VRESAGKTSPEKYPKVEQKSEREKQSKKNVV